MLGRSPPTEWTTRAKTRTSQVCPQASTKLDQEVLPTGDQRNYPLYDQGNRLLMTVTHSVEKERCLKVKSSMGGRMIRLPKATYRPPPTSLTFPSTSSLSHENLAHPLLIHPSRPTRPVSEEEAERWPTNALITFCEQSIQGFPPGDHNLGLQATSPRPALKMGDPDPAIGTALRWRTD